MSTWSAIVVGAPRIVGAQREATVQFSKSDDPDATFTQSFLYTLDSQLTALAAGRIAAAEASQPTAAAGTALDVAPLQVTAGSDDPLGDGINPTRLKLLILSIGDVATAFHAGDVPTVVDTLNTPSITVLSRPMLTKESLLGILPQETQVSLQAYLADNPNTGLLNTAILEQNRSDVGFWVSAFLAKGVITSDHATTVFAALAHQDSETISPAVQEFGAGAVISFADVQRLLA